MDSPAVNVCITCYIRRNRSELTSSVKKQSIDEYIQKDIPLVHKNVELATFLTATENQDECSEAELLTTRHYRKCSTQFLACLCYAYGLGLSVE